MAFALGVVCVVFVVINIFKNSVKPEKIVLGVLVLMAGIGLIDYWLNAMVVPPTSAYGTLSAVSVGIAGYHRTTGLYPSKLNDMVPDYIDYIPNDDLLTYTSHENGWLLRCKDKSADCEIIKGLIFADSSFFILEKGADCRPFQIMGFIRPKSIGDIISGRSISTSKVTTTQRGGS